MVIETKSKRLLKINEQIRKFLYNWIMNNTKVVQSSIANECLKVKIDGYTNRNLFQKFYFRCLLENFITILSAPQKMVDQMKLEMQRVISLSVIIHCVHYFHPNLKMSLRYKFMFGCECLISSKSMHSSLLSWRDNLYKTQGYQTKFSKHKVWKKIK